MMSPPQFAIDSRRAAEFRGPHDQCLIEHSEPFQILQQSGNWLVDLFCQRCVFGHIPMGIPIARRA